MRRTRNDGTKVWHNPDVDTFARRRGQGSAKPLAERPEDRRAAKEHRAALEALFAPRKDPAPEPVAAEAPRAPAPPKSAGRIVLAPPPQSDPKTAERQRLLSKLLLAEGRPGVSKAANDFLRAGFTFPDEQDVHLQLLEHTSEEHVKNAIDALAVLLVSELPKRRAVLESRLRRIEEFAEEAGTRCAAERLRRQVSGRPESPRTR